MRTEELAAVLLDLADQIRSLDTEQWPRHDAYGSGIRIGVRSLPEPAKRSGQLLQSVAVGLLDEHIRHCVSDAARGDDADRAADMVTEATRAIERLVKS